MSRNPVLQCWDPQWVMLEHELKAYGIAWNHEQNANEKVLDVNRNLV